MKKIIMLMFLLLCSNNLFSQSGQLYKPWEIFIGAFGVDPDEEVIFKLEAVGDVWENPNDDPDL